jgi:hypothetical protein
MQRIKPSEDFIGLSHLKDHHKASLKLHCALKNDPYLDLNLPNQRLKTVSQNMVNFTHFNLNNRLPCSNRDLNKGNFQILKQPDVVSFKRGEVFETNHFKIVLDAEFRGDEKPPVWLFTNKTNEIFFTFTGKIRDPKIDTLEVYKYYLDNPIPFKDLNGVEQESQPIKVQYQMIGGQKWVDGLHYNSEKNGYFTRYLATTYKDKAYLFTLNVHKSYYLKYSDKIAKMISSIRIDGTNPNIKYRDEALRRNYLTQTKSTPTGDSISGLYDENLRSVNSVERQKFNPIYFYLGIILVLSSGVYFWINRRKYTKKHTE